MAHGVYVGVDGKARKIKKIYVGMDGKARKVKKAYIGVDGKARLFYTTDYTSASKTGTLTNTVNWSETTSMCRNGSYLIIAQNKGYYDSQPNSVRAITSGLTWTTMTSFFTHTEKRRVVASQVGNYAIFVNVATADTPSAYNNSLTRTSVSGISGEYWTFWQSLNNNVTKEYAFFITTSRNVVRYNASLTKTSALPSTWGGYNNIASGGTSYFDERTYEANHGSIASVNSNNYIAVQSGDASNYYARYWLFNSSLTQISWNYGDLDNSKAGYSEQIYWGTASANVLGDWYYVVLRTAHYKVTSSGTVTYLRAFGGGQIGPKKNATDENHTIAITTNSRRWGIVSMNKSGTSSTAMSGDSSASAELAQIVGNIDDKFICPLGPDVNGNSFTTVTTYADIITAS